MRSTLDELDGFVTQLIRHSRVEKTTGQQESETEREKEREEEKAEDPSDSGTSEFSRRQGQSGEVQDEGTGGGR
jgi:hypothetical protein